MTSSSITSRASATCASSPSSVSWFPRSRTVQCRRSRSASSTPSLIPASSAATSFETSSTSCTVRSVGRVPSGTRGAFARRREHRVRLDACEETVERPRDAPEVERFHQQDGVPLLAVPHEAVQLILERPGAVRGLPLVRPERAQLALLREHALHAVRPHRPRQLVLEIARAGIEPGPLELTAVAAPERAQEMPLLPDVVEPREPGAAVLREGAWQVAVPAHRHDRDAVRLEVAAEAASKRLDGAAVTRALDENDPACLHERPNLSRAVRP